MTAFIFLICMTVDIVIFQKEKKRTKKQQTNKQTTQTNKQTKKPM